MEDLKYKKQILLEICLAIFICILAVIIFFFSFNNETVETSTSNTISYNNIETNELITVVLENTSSEEVTGIVTNEKASDKKLNEEKVTQKEEKSSSPYYIKVNYSANVVTIYTKDDDDNYTVPYKAMICSCGKYTPKSGTYQTSDKYTWRPLLHDVYGQYATRIVKKILFHSVPYSSNKKDTLLYEEYDKLGTKASDGCVRLTVADAKWIYDNCPSNTIVEFYSNSNPGPLGKPTAQKISSIEECRNWDPTDPATENPWHTYEPEEEKPSEDIINNVTNNITNNITNDNINNTIVDNSSSLNNTINNNVVENNIDNDIQNNNSPTGNNIINNPDNLNNIAIPVVNNIIQNII